MANCDSYPKFEENQVLTAKQLNDLADHLLQADRRALDRLAGIGVVCGLEPSNPTVSRNSVALSKGCGVTSKGFLVAMDEDATFTRYRPYTDPAGYVPFKSNGGQIDLYELLPAVVADEDSSIKALSKDFIKDKAVLAYMEQKEVDLKTCTAEDCDERGKHVHLCVKILLIGFSDLKKIILAAHQLNQSTDLDDHFNARFDLVDVRLPRLYDLLSLKPDSQFEDLKKLYEKILEQGVEVIQKAFSDAYEKFYLLLKEDWPQNPFESDFLKEALGKDPVNGDQAIQYFCDFLKDLALAYDEFKAAAFDLAGRCCPDEGLFAKHLMLGEALQTDSCRPSVFRKEFVPSPIHDGPRDKYDEFAMLFARMVLMVEAFSVPEFEAEIKITPSSEKGTPLGKRAIPYYYSPADSQNPLYKSWSFDLARKCVPDRALSYHADQYATSPDLEFVRTPLKYDIDPYPFFRMEGHLRQKFAEGLAKLQTLAEDHNLPVKVLGLRLSENSDALDIFGCQMYDLEAAYAALRSEYLCMFQKAVDFFSQLEIGTTEQVYEDKDTGVRGTVSILKGEPVTGVDVLLSDSRFRSTIAKTVTDEKGNYEILGIEPDKYYLSVEIQNRNFKKTLVAIQKDKTLVVDVKLDPEVIEEEFGIKETRVSAVDYSTGAKAGKDVLVGEKKSFASRMAADTMAEEVASAQTSVGLALNEQAAGAAQGIAMQSASHFQVGGFYEVFQDTGSSGDLLGFSYDYFNIYPFLKTEDIPGTVVNDLYFPVKLLAAIEKAEKLLPEKLADFDIEAFKSAYDEIVRIAEDYAKQIQENLKTPKYNPKGNEDEILEQLKMLTEGCHIERLGGIVSTLETRKNEIRALTLFSNFAAKHPGLEHLGGAPRGGTFVLVYDDEGVIVADFALPYNCCSDCPPITCTIMPEPPQLVLPRTLFCDQAIQHPPKFGYSPAGGEVKGPGVRKIGGDFYFLPDEAGPGEHSITYEIGGSLKASLQVAVLATPEAKFRVDVEKREEDDEVVVATLANDTQGQGLAFLWEYSYGEKPPEEISRVREPGLIELKLPVEFDRFTIILTAKNSRETVVCEDSAQKEIVVEQPVEGSIDLGGLEIFCDQPLEEPPMFNVVPEEKGEVIGAGVLEGDDGKFYFLPDKAGPGEHGIDYVIDGDAVASMGVLVVETPAPGFECAIIDRTSEEVIVSLKNTTPDKDYMYRWLFQTAESGPKEFSREKDVEMAAIPVPASENQFQITLVATNVSSGVECSGTITKTIVLEQGGDFRIDLGGQVEFCADPKAEPVKINLTPQDPDGKVSGPGVIRDDAGHWFFTPSNAGPGEHKIDYVIDGNAVASMGVLVVETPAPGFEHTVLDRTSEEVIVSLKNTTPDKDYMYRWLFQTAESGLKEFSREKDVEKAALPVPASENQFQIALFATDVSSGVECSGTITKTIVLEQDGDFRIDLGGQVEFCADPKAEPVKINLTPQDPNGKVSGPGAVRDDAGDWLFIPSSAGPGKHRLSYAIDGKEVAGIAVIVIELPQPSFKTEFITFTEKGFRIVFFNTMQTEASKYEWSYSVDGKAPVVFFKARDPEEQELAVSRDFEIVSFTLRAINVGEKVECGREATEQFSF